MFKIIRTLFFIIVTFSVSQFVFNPLNLYYELWWLDIPMHILGGFLFGLLSIDMYRYMAHENNKLNFNLKLNLYHVLFFVFSIGVLWEIYEYIMGVYGIYLWGGPIDTVKDIFDDLIGAAIAYHFNIRENKYVKN